MGNWQCYHQRATTVRFNLKKNRVDSCICHEVIDENTKAKFCHSDGSYVALVYVTFADVAHIVRCGIRPYGTEVVNISEFASSATLLAAAKDY
mgnify:CR=1 FL=1